MENSQKGFSLIEIMIVFIILGLLASIALPAYRSYITRAQIAEGSTLLNSLKSPLADAIANSGLAGCIIPAGSVISGEYVSSISATTGSNICIVTAVYGFVGNENVINKIITQSYNMTTNRWSCETNLPYALAPEGCTIIL